MRKLDFGEKFGIAVFVIFTIAYEVYLIAIPLLKG
jgi:hypothetical protein